MSEIDDTVLFLFHCFVFSENLQNTVRVKCEETESVPKNLPQDVASVSTNETLGVRYTKFAIYISSEKFDLPQDKEITGAMLPNPAFHVVITNKLLSQCSTQTVVG